MTISRSFLTMKLPNTDEVLEARVILKTWAKLRSTPRNFARAIRLYNALLEGNVDLFWRLLNEFFPGFALAAKFNEPVRSLDTALPPPVYTQQKLSFEPVAIAADTEESDDFGFADVNFD